MSPIGGDERNGSNFRKKCVIIDENVAELCDKILQNLSNTFDKDDLLDEFDIIPCESKLNQSPVIHDLTSHKLALESWCVPYLYKHSYHQFLWICRKSRKPSTSSSSNTTIQSSNSGSRRDSGNIASSKREKELSRKLSCLSESERISKGLLLSRALIIINPELTLAWNYRRDYFHPTSLEALEREQRFVSLVMSRKPKCPEGFTYRKWLIKKALQKCLVEPSRIQDFISHEIDMIEQPIRSYSTNYHAWSYRFWLLELVLTYDKTVVSKDQKERMLDRELQKSNTWIKSNVSDYSGCHYRQKLLECMLNFGTDGTLLLLKELDENEKRIFIFEGHESLWHHRRAIILLSMNHFKKFKDNNSSKAPPSSEEYDGLEALEKTLQDKESDLVQQIESKNYNDTENECSQLNSTLCQAHVKWMGRRLKWDLTKSVHLEV
ncbi:Protein prenyltransferase alpha subunit repeat-containing protein 1 [Orchesella cincta]|uniref:Protein prenyltransferase alpha subunit repeat-containing protein 1 n=1 Tax=Orchesella cincta TaxID=48709 RepID=A0A1D2N266_ORCCI|nr:Protein prenyltransferase alpha subunit repeat-containing protein 1 [Orchesella cincta]